MHRAVLALALGLLSTAPAAAVQPGVPEPVRLPDGKPNWTGFWALQGGVLQKDFGPGFVAPAPKAGDQAKEVAPKQDDKADGSGEPKLVGPAALLKSPYREQFIEILKKEAQGEPAFDPTSVCFPPGMPRMMNMTYGMEILQTPKVIAITSEWGPGTRRIWMDGRSHPPAEILDPTYAGHSIGRWEGDVLVVDTVGLRTEAVITQQGLMHSDKLRLEERFYSPKPGVLVDEITVIDPEVFTAPWKMVRAYDFMPELSLQEYVCQDNNRNITPDGKPDFGPSAR
ncbi:MAG: hypothetical protein JNK21_00185 [Rhodospirillaceae bacterium]|nr:hypothetical protein [Rhodospirillaceae bacterium]